MTLSCAICVLGCSSTSNRPLCLGTPPTGWPALIVIVSACSTAGALAAAFVFAPVVVARVRQVPCPRRRAARGDDRNRTGVRGFAGRCVATPPRRHRLRSLAVTARRAGRDRRARADKLAQLPGRLAQLGERRLDKAEVTGSSPVSPTQVTGTDVGHGGVEGFLRFRSLAAANQRAVASR